MIFDQPLIFFKCKGLAQNTSFVTTVTWFIAVFKPVLFEFLGGCEDCQCNQVGTIGALGVCDTLDGQCACKPNVGGSRVCDECHDGFYGLEATNGLVS